MAAEQRARHPAIGALGTVLVDHVEQSEFSPRCWLPCHRRSPLVVRSWIGRSSRAASRHGYALGQGKYPAPQRRFSRSWQRSDALKVRGGQLPALTHNVVGELLPFMQAAHSGTLDGGNMHEHIFSATVRREEPQTLFLLQKPPRTVSNTLPPSETCARLH